MSKSPDPPGEPTLTMTNKIWLENRTYTATCEATSGNPPDNIYTWYLDGSYVHTGASYSVRATKGLKDIRCYVTNDKYKQLSRFDDETLDVHCKITEFFCYVNFS